MMETQKIIVYDGSFNGFLSVVYTCFENRWKAADIIKAANKNDDLFVTKEYVSSDPQLAQLVWNGLAQKNHSAIKRIYFAFLSEHQNIEMVLFNYILYVMDRPTALAGQEGQQNIDLLNSLVQKVENEKRRMEIFAQFQLAQEFSDGVHLRPKFNVLPLLSKHLKQTLRGKEWQIYDDKRKYGISFAYGKLELLTNLAQVAQAV